MTGNGKLCKNFFKKQFLQNVLAFIDLFYQYYYVRYFIYSDCMWHHVFMICTEEATTGGVLENFANFAGKLPIKLKPIKPLGWLTSLSHSTWITPETERENLIFTEFSCFVQLHQEPREELIYQVYKTNACD